MSNAGGCSLTRSQSGERFYCPPALRRQQQQQSPSKESPVDSTKAASRTDSDESILAKPNSVCSSSPSFTNLDRLMESVTPVVPAQCFPEVRVRKRNTHDSHMRPFFLLGDLWESYKEWSLFGVGVPLLLNGSDPIEQYYVPLLSGIQLYIDPFLLRRPGDDSDVEYSRETSGVGSRDCEVERQTKGIADGAWGQQDVTSLNSQKLNRLSLIDRPVMASSSNTTEVCKPSGMLVYEYLEQELPYQRKPLFDKVTILAAQCPGLKMYRSCDLLPSSWISVAWYPIYRIPVGPTLQNLDASFLTFHFLSTESTSKVYPQFNASGSRTINGMDRPSKFSLPVFGLASYKLRGSILTPKGAYEQQQSNSLLEAADNWLHGLQVNLPDFQFFASHNSKWR